MKAILNLKKEKVTTIIIAHRLSTLEECDNIFLIDKGKLKKQKNFPI
jgi:ATP-binding cassette subfamily B protein